jgi:hypothetical protein
VGIQPSSLRPEVSEECPHKKQGEANRSSYTNRWDADANQQSQCARCFEDA